MICFCHGRFTHVHFLMPSQTSVPMAAMESITSSLLPVSPALVGGEAPVSVQNQPVVFDNPISVPLLVEGDTCGYLSPHKNASICGYGRCCSLKSVRCLLPRTAPSQHANLKNNRINVALMSYRAVQSTVPLSTAPDANCKAGSTTSYSHTPHRSARTHHLLSGSDRARPKGMRTPVPHLLRACLSAHLCPG